MRYLSLAELPKKPTSKEEEKLDKFWKHLESDAIKDVVSLLIVNEVRVSNPGQMTDDERIASLARMKAWQEIMDFAPWIEKKQKEEQEEKEEEEEL